MSHVKSMRASISHDEVERERELWAAGKRSIGFILGKRRTGQ